MPAFRSTLFLSSNPSLAAENRSTDGSRFEINLNSALAISARAEAIQLCVSQASIWNTSPNIAASFANNLFRYTTTSVPAGQYDIIIPDGLWSLSGLGAYLSTQFTNNGHSAALYTLSGLDSTQQTVITVANTGDSIQMASAPNSVATILGYTVDIVAPVASYNAFSQNPANFNRNNSYTIQSNICDGLVVNRATSGVIASIPISEPPGSLINFDPRQLTWIPCPELRGVARTRLTFQLGNQDLVPTPTAGELFTFIIQIRWFEP
jgi:hypothetical protein